MAAPASTVSPRLVRSNEAARYLGIHRSTLHREVVAGRIRPITHLKYWLFDIHDLNNYIDSLKEEA